MVKRTAEPYLWIKWSKEHKLVGLVIALSDILRDSESWTQIYTCLCAKKQHQLLSKRQVEQFRPHAIFIQTLSCPSRFGQGHFYWCMDTNMFVNSPLRKCRGRVQGFSMELRKIWLVEITSWSADKYCF